MQVLITGGTGLIGSALTRYWQSAQIWILSRQQHTSEQANVRYVTSLELLDFNTLDVVINLAGEPIANKRWSQQQKDRICQSRWQLTEKLAALITAAARPPRVFISGSAIGIYGRQGEQEITEDFQGCYPEFSHDICARWEKLALAASSAETRVCLLRTGIVLAETGGALQKMRLPFKLGLGGVIGSGNQYMSWIHLEDMVSMIDFIVKNDSMVGPINAVAPNAVTNRAFTAALATQLRRPTLLPMPTFMARLLFGEMSDILLYGQRVVPAKLLQAGFVFRYTQLHEALAAL